MSKATERFIRAWQAAGSVAEAAKALGRPRGSVAVAACNYRKRGIPLKWMPGARVTKRPMSVAALLRMARHA